MRGADGGESGVPSESSMSLLHTYLGSLGGFVCPNALCTYCTYLMIEKKEKMNKQQVASTLQSKDSRCMRSTRTYYIIRCALEFHLSTWVVTVCSYKLCSREHALVCFHLCMVL